MLTPTLPTKMIALRNNFHALAVTLNNAIPAEPLWFLRAPNSFLAHGETMRSPASYSGKVVYEGGLGIVIGRRCRCVAENEAAAFIFGYTCINDVTAAETINRDPAFQPWSRATSHDTFGVFAPVVATDIEPAGLRVQTRPNGQERQNHAVAGMICPPTRLVSLLSRDMTLEAGDVICCGTSLGAGSMKPGSTVEVTIEGIGTLANRFE